MVKETTCSDDARKVSSVMLYDCRNVYCYGAATTYCIVCMDAEAETDDIDDGVNASVNVALRFI